MRFIMPSLIFDIERWKWNEKYGLYVSTFGRFKNVNKQIIKPKVRNNYFWIYIPNTGGYEPAHRIVLMTFKPLNDSKPMTVDHINSNTRDNKLRNLEWVTKEENSRRAQENQFVETEVVYTPPVKLNPPSTIKIPKNKPINFYNLKINPKYNTLEWSYILNEIKDNAILFRSEGNRYTALQYVEKYKPANVTNLDRFIHKTALAAARKETVNGRVIELIKV